ncbi:ferredoxin-2, mitochondrial [Enteropsectra breve]|nr:ferredoxin-2, mitochondrial [Enteropsectra breve]
MEKYKNTINIFFKHLGKLIPARAKIGENLLTAAHSNAVPLEGACEGSLACSTCHVVCDPTVFKEKEISDRENDLLDLAFGLSPTSRLGCQVKVTKDMQNKVFEIPRCTRNLAVDGYRPPVH